MNPNYYSMDSPTYNSIRALKLAHSAGKAVGSSIKDWINKKQQGANKRKKAGQGSSKKKMPKAAYSGSYASNPVKSLTTRSARKITGKTKTKVVKTVAVPSRLRKQIKQVLVGQQAVGSYTTIKEGFVGSLMPAPANPGPLLGAALGNPQNVVYFGFNNYVPGRTYYNALVTRLDSPGVSSVIAGTELNFFTPAKLLDAASVLFNGKTVSIDPYIETGNLSTVSNSNDGATNFNNPGKLKINILNSYAKFSIKNVSNRVVTMEIWECMPSQMFQETNPLNTLNAVWEGFGSSTGVTGQDTAYAYYDLAAPGGAALSSLTRGFYECGQDPFDIAKQNYDFKFTWKKRTMILAPEETCVHSIRGPKGIFDYSKMQRSNNANPQPAPIISRTAMMKGWSVGCVIGISGDQVLTQTAAASQGGRKNYLGGGSITLGMPVCVEVEEYYKIAVPEIAGFRQSATNIVMPLNQRKAKHIVFSQKEKGQNNFTVSNEVNPIADTVINTQNQ